MAVLQSKIDFDHLGIGTLLLRDRLAVPVNQREYAWKREHVLDLFHDFSDAIDKSKPAYFLGTIVLTAGKSPDAWDVTDGQQRLATTIILLAAIRDYLADREDAKLIIQSIERFLFDIDRERNDLVPRLSLNLDDNEFFKNRILPLPGDSKRAIQPTKPSHEKIEEAAREAAEHVQTIVAGKSESSHVAALNTWITFIEKAAQIIILKVPDDMNAYVMFETLNDRGLKTNQADMLKNYLLGQSGNRMQEAMHRWGEMKSALESAESDEIVLTYLRHLLVSRYGAIRDREVYEKIKKVVSGTQPAIAFLGELAENATLYVAMFNHRHPHWQSYGNYSPRIRKHVETLNELRVEQLRPLMLACMRRFTNQELAKAFRLFISWAVRFMVSGSPTGTVEKYYAGRAVDVWKGDVGNAADLARVMNKYLPDDDAFASAFTGLRVAKPHLARYYLRSLDRKMKGDAEPEYVANSNETEVTVEHVLPENPGPGWEHVDEAAAEAFYRRLGNMILLRASVNSRIGNGPFEEKKQSYKDSTFQVNRYVMRCKDWGPAQISERQAKLAELVAEIWPLDVH